MIKLRNVTPADDTEKCINVRCLSLSKLSVIKSNDWSAVRCSICKDTFADKLVDIMASFRAEPGQEDHIKTLLRRIEFHVKGLFDYLEEYLLAEIGMLIDAKGELQCVLNYIYLLQREPFFEPLHAKKPTVDPRITRGNFVSGILYAAAICEKGSQFPNKLSLILVDDNGQIVPEFAYFRYPNVQAYFSALYNHNHDIPEGELIRRIPRVRDAKALLSRHNVRRLVIVFGSPWATFIERLICGIMDLDVPPNPPQHVIGPLQQIDLEGPNDDTNHVFRQAMLIENEIAQQPDTVGTSLQVDWMSRLLTSVLALHPLFKSEFDQDRTSNFLQSATLAAICITTCPTAASILLTSTIGIHNFCLNDILCEPISGLYLNQAVMRLMRSVVNLYQINRSFLAMEYIISGNPFMAPLTAAFRTLQDNIVSLQMNPAKQQLQAANYHVGRDLVGVLPQVQLQHTNLSHVTLVPIPKVVSEFQAQVFEVDKNLPTPHKDWLRQCFQNLPEINIDIKLLACETAGCSALYDSMRENLQVNVGYAPNPSEWAIPSLANWIGMVNLSHEHVRIILASMIESATEEEVKELYGQTEFVFPNWSAERVDTMRWLKVLVDLKNAKIADIQTFIEGYDQMMDNIPFRAEELINRLTLVSNGVLPSIHHQEPATSPFSKIQFCAMKTLGKHVLFENKFDESAMWPYNPRYAPLYHNDVWDKYDDQGNPTIFQMSLRIAVNKVVLTCAALKEIQQRRFRTNDVQWFTTPIASRETHSVIVCRGGEYLECADNSTCIGLFDKLRPYKTTFKMTTGPDLATASLMTPHEYKMWKSKPVNRTANTFLNQDFEPTFNGKAHLIVKGTFCDVGAFWHVESTEKMPNFDQ